MPPFSLIETFRWSQGAGFIRLDNHLDRLAASAAALGFLFDRADALARLETEAFSGEDRRVRLALTPSGELDLTHRPTGEAKTPVRLHIAPDPLDETDPLLRHKTSRRAAYEAADAFALEGGADEGLLLNRSGAVADAARSTVFARLGGALVTPPVSHGALPGVLRACLIVKGQATVRRLTPQDLAEAEQLFVGSSLQGLRPALIA